MGALELFSLRNQFSTIATMLLSVPLFVFSKFSFISRLVRETFVFTSSILSKRTSRPLLERYRSTAPIFPLKMLYTGTPSAAAVQNLSHFNFQIFYPTKLIRTASDGDRSLSILPQRQTRDSQECCFFLRSSRGG